MIPKENKNENLDVENQKKPLIGLIRCNGKWREKGRKVHREALSVMFGRPLESVFQL
jgi:hypothetical protein